MWLIINAVLSPNFCAIVSDNGLVKKSIFWEDPKKAGSVIWDFLEKNFSTISAIKMAGGIAGPGGFSVLRTTSMILKTLQLEKNCIVCNVDTFSVICMWKEKKKSAKNFLLTKNTQSVWVVGGEKPVLMEWKTAKKFDATFLNKKTREKFSLPESQTKPEKNSEWIKIVWKSLKETGKNDFEPQYGES